MKYLLGAFLATWLFGFATVSLIGNTGYLLEVVFGVVVYSWASYKAASRRY